MQAPRGWAVAGGRVGRVTCQQDTTSTWPPNADFSPGRGVGSRPHLGVARLGRGPEPRDGGIRLCTARGGSFVLIGPSLTTTKWGGGLGPTVE